MSHIVHCHCWCCAHFLTVAKWLIRMRARLAPVHIPGYKYRPVKSCVMRAQCTLWHMSLVGILEYMALHINSGGIAASAARMNVSYFMRSTSHAKNIRRVGAFTAIRIAICGQSGWATMSCMCVYLAISAYFNVCIESNLQSSAATKLIING